MCDGIEHTKAGDEAGTVGDVEIVDAGVDRGAGEGVGLGAVALKGAGGVDDGKWFDLGKRPRDLIGARHVQSIRAASVGGAEYCKSCGVTPCAYDVIARRCDQLARQ